MGKKRIATQDGKSEQKQTKNAGKSPKRRLDRGILFVQATYNNTLLNLADSSGNSVAWSSSGSLGFKGAKKGTPFAAGKVAEILADKALAAGMKEIDVVMNGVGAGRESAVRTFITKGINLSSIKDVTPIPFNGPKLPKPRRV